MRQVSILHPEHPTARQCVSARGKARAGAIARPFGALHDEGHCLFMLSRCVVSKFLLWVQFEMSMGGGSKVKVMKMCQPKYTVTKVPSPNGSKLVLQVCKVLSPIRDAQTLLSLVLRVHSE